MGDIFTPQQTAGCLSALLLFLLSKRKPLLFSWAHDHPATKMTVLSLPRSYNRDKEKK